MRKEIVADVLRFLEKRFPAGIQMFDSRNTVGDEMDTIYDKDGIVIDYAVRYDYVEIFNLTDEEYDFVADTWDCSFGGEIDMNWREKIGISEVNMTREEAIKNLNIMLDSAQRRTKRNIVIPDLIKAIEMAIEALKERPHGAWEGEEKSRMLITRKCNACGCRSAVGNFCMWCGSDNLKSGEANE